MEGATATMASDNEFEQEFNYVNLQEVDPNLKAIDEDVYTLKVIKLAIQKKADFDGTLKPNLSARFGVTNHEKFSGRTLWHTFWQIQDNDSFDAKALRRIADATGTPATGGLPAWVEDMNSAQPEFKVQVKKGPPTKWNKETREREVKVGPDGNPLPDINVINFWNVSIAG